MKIEKTIRKQVLAGNSDRIRELLLTDNQIKLIQDIKQDGIITTSILADNLCVSSQNASSKLNRLYKAGYLIRRSRIAESGGIEFIYYYGAEI